MPAEPEQLDEGVPEAEALRIEGLHKAFGDLEVEIVDRMHAAKGLGQGREPNGGRCCCHAVASLPVL